MRGRTFLNRFLILDEAQNLTPKQMKALTTQRRPRHQARLPRQHRPDRYALPYGDDLGSHVCRESLPRLGRIPDTSLWCAGNARGSPISPRTSCRCTLECVPQSVFVSLCKPGEILMTAIGGQTPIMRRLLPAPSWPPSSTLAGVAFADDPPSTAADPAPPRRRAADLPDMAVRRPRSSRTPMSTASGRWWRTSCATRTRCSRPGNQRVHELGGAAARFAKCRRLAGTSSTS